LSLGKRVFCNGDEMTKDQPSEIAKAWVSLSANKYLKVKNLKKIDKSSLYEAYLAGWLIFEKVPARWI
jgi:50S ribosomal protein L16 3-hydroxylase